MLKFWFFIKFLKISFKFINKIIPPKILHSPYNKSQIKIFNYTTEHIVNAILNSLTKFPAYGYFSLISRPLFYSFPLYHARSFLCFDFFRLRWVCNSHEGSRQVKRVYHDKFFNISWFFAFLKFKIFLLRKVFTFNTFFAFNVRATWEFSHHCAIFVCFYCNLAFHRKCTCYR